MDINRYTYRTEYVPDDGEHVGLCLEWPSLSWLDSTPESALEGIRWVVNEAVADMRANGETVPDPADLPLTVAAAVRR